jgi:hypothetical protein
MQDIRQVSLRYAALGAQGAVLGECRSRAALLLAIEFLPTAPIQLIQNKAGAIPSL